VSSEEPGHFSLTESHFRICLADGSERRIPRPYVTKTVVRQRKDWSVELMVGDMKSLLLHFPTSVPWQSPELPDTTAWEYGKMCNFEYLLLLNSAAGRFFLDSVNYPIMPWVVADYSRTKLDLADPTVFRSFATARPLTDHARFYLVRVEPFATAHCQRNDGLFDSSDHLFTSVAAAFTDDRSPELPPEFFISPEFLLNSNNFKELDNIVLPEWAASPVDFVYQNRKALKSKFVTASLPAWIDLVWGVSRGSSEPGLFTTRHPHRQPTAKAASSILEGVRLLGKVHAVTFSEGKVWFLDSQNTVDFLDLQQEKVPRLNLRRDNPTGPVLIATSGSMICCVFSSKRRRITVFIDDRGTALLRSLGFICLMHCNGELVAWVDFDSVLTVQDIRSPAPLFSVSLNCPVLTALFVSVGLYSVVCGAKDGFIHFVSLASKTCIRSVTLRGARPVKLLVTDAWGFVVVCVEECKKAGVAFGMMVFTINGLLVVRKELRAVVRHWATWTSPDGFDWVVAIDDGNRMFVFEAYYGDIARPVAQLHERVLCVSYWKKEDGIVIVLESGAIEFRRVAELMELAAA
jgi:hypothetical protein